MSITLRCIPFTGSLTILQLTVDIYRWRTVSLPSVFLLKGFAFHCLHNTFRLEGNSLVSDFREKPLNLRTFPTSFTSTTLFTTSQTSSYMFGVYHHHKVKLTQQFFC